MNIDFKLKNYGRLIFTFTTVLLMIDLWMGAINHPWLVSSITHQIIVFAFNGTDPVWQLKTMAWSAEILLNLTLVLVSLTIRMKYFSNKRNFRRSTSFFLADD